MPVTKEEREAAAIELRAYFKGRRSREMMTVYTTVESVSRSGMSRKMTIRIIRNNQPLNITYLVAKATGYRLDGDGRLKVDGCKMDMGLSVVYNLSDAIYSGTSRHRRFKKSREGTSRRGSAGYILHQRWL